MQRRTLASLPENLHIATAAVLLCSVIETFICSWPDYGINYMHDNCTFCMRVDYKYAQKYCSYFCMGYIIPVVHCTCGSELTETETDSQELAVSGMDRYMIYAELLAVLFPYHFLYYNSL